MEEIELAEWYFNKCPPELRIKLKYSLKEVKILVVLSYGEDGYTKQAIEQHTGIPMNGLGGCLSDLVRKDLLISAHPYSRNTRYEITRDGKDETDNAMEIMRDAKKVHTVTAS